MTNRREPGPVSSKLVSEEQTLIAPGIQRLATMAGLAMESGHGCMLEDVDGQTYLDFMAGVGVASLGHSHPRWARAIANQAQKLSIGSFASEPRLALLQLMASLLPGSLRRVQLYSSGAEAVEAAVRLAKAHTQRWEVVAFWGGFHGKTGGVLPLIGDPFKQGWGPLAPGALLVPYADPYRPVIQTADPADFAMACVDLARKQIDASSQGSVAAVIVEPIQGTAGNVVPPPEWLPAIAELAHDLGALLIVDEMITGFGRTGKMFAFEHLDVTPDILTLGKGFGGGFPVTAVVADERIAQDSHPWSKPSSSSSSVGGNPLAAAAALATLETILEENLVENSRCVGAHMLERLQTWPEKFPCVGDVRGQGLLIGMDLVSDRETREPLPVSVTEKIYTECVARGLLLMAYGPRVRINPPLVLTEAEADTGLDILESVIRDVVPAPTGR